MLDDGQYLLGNLQARIAMRSAEKSENLSVVEQAIRHGISAGVHVQALAPLLVLKDKLLADKQRRQELRQPATRQQVLQEWLSSEQSYSAKMRDALSLYIRPIHAKQFLSMIEIGQVMALVPIQLLSPYSFSVGCTCLLTVCCPLLFLSVLPLRRCLDRWIH